MNKEALVNSIETALQGLVYWISYRQILYSWYPLNEGALVAEFVNLLNAKLGKDFKISCESPYSKHGGQRMDVEIRQKHPDRRVAAIEFKRNLAGKSSINDDIEKLLQIEDGEVWRFLVVVSEKELPKGYVNDKGEAGNKNLCRKDGFSAKVTRVLKSTKSFRWKKDKDKKTPPKANYCCLIEIKPENPPAKGGKK